MDRSLWRLIHRCVYRVRTSSLLLEKGIRFFFVCQSTDRSEFIWETKGQIGYHPWCPLSLMRRTNPSGSGGKAISGLGGGRRNWRPEPCEVQGSHAPDGGHGMFRLGHEYSLGMRWGFISTSSPGSWESGQRFSAWRWILDSEKSWRV